MNRLSLSDLLRTMTSKRGLKLWAVVLVLSMLSFSVHVMRASGQLVGPPI